MTNWQEMKAYEDITYHKADGLARIAFDSPQSAMHSVREQLTR